MSLRRPDAQDVVIIGATGDLARRKLIPALYSLFVDEILPAQGRIIGYARRELDDDAFRALAKEAVQKFAEDRFDGRAWEAFEKRLVFVSGRTDGYAKLAALCELPQRVIYLSTPPSAYPAIVRELGEHSLIEGTRLVIEKPFGRDLASARELERTLHEFFDEQQIFRIDHFLGKETVQNILVFRFGNSLFERVWNRDAIDHIQITVAESIGIEGRGAFYEETGAIRDIIQNHAVQVLSVLTMEPPRSFSAEAIRDEKAKLFHSMQCAEPAQVVRGQYTRGTIAGEEVPGYREEPGVAPGSTVETFAAVRLLVDNWRWAGVPFFLRTGKRLPRTATEVNVWFRDVPIRFFEDMHIRELPPNHLSICIQPDQSITLVFLAKVPGPEVEVHPVRMEFSYGESFMAKPAEAYERLLHDVMDGDPTLFARADGVDRTWEIIQPVLDDPPPVRFYPAGTWGPKEADGLTAPRRWHLR